MTAVTDPARRRAALATLHGYCERVDAADADGVAALFTEDAEATYGPATRARGREEVAGLVRQLLGACERTSHHASTISLCERGDGTVAARCGIVAWHRLRPAGTELVVMGHYEDVLVPGGDGFLIARRELRVHGSSGPDLGFTPLPRAG